MAKRNTTTAPSLTLSLAGGSAKGGTRTCVERPTSLLDRLRGSAHTILYEGIDAGQRCSELR